MIKKSILKLADLAKIKTSLGHSPSWQKIKNNSYQKAFLIEKELSAANCLNFLDIGCNAGQVTRLLSANRFAAGIDQKIDFRGFDAPLKGALLGEIQLSPETARAAPRFDAVLLLSVHHQWHANMPEKKALSLFQHAASIPLKLLIVEFAAIRSKYGFHGGQFIDNDQDSVCEYATNYLKKNLPSGYGKIKFIGSTPEYPQIEPFRYMFACLRSGRFSKAE